MRKRTVFLLIAGLCLVVAPQLQADGHFFGNFGIITDDTFTFDPLVWYFGVNLDFSFGDILFLSPEANIGSLNFDFKDFVFEPSLLLNLKLSNFFAGAGISRFFFISGGGTYEIDEWMLKMNAGFTGGNFRFRVFMDTPFNDLFGWFLVGMQFGIGF